MIPNVPVIALAAAVFLVPVTAVVGQEAGAGRLDELGFATAPPPGVECPSDVDWPPLPAEGRQVFRSGRLDFVVGEPRRGAPIRGETRSPAPDPDVEIPQYGYFLSPRPHPGLEHVPCRPVIFVQAERGAIGWVSLQPRGPSGGANRQHFIPLGTEPPHR